MNDNEIKNAFANYIKNGSFYSGRRLLLKQALDIINRLEAENERLNKENDRLSQCVMYHDGQISDAKAEAVKAFVKKFEKKIKNVKFTIGQTWEIKCALKQILQEMTGVNK